MGLFPPNGKLSIHTRWYQSKSMCTCAFGHCLCCRSHVCLVLWSCFVRHLFVRQCVAVLIDSLSDVVSSLNGPFVPNDCTHSNQYTNTVSGRNRQPASTILRSVRWGSNKQEKRVSFSTVSCRRKAFPPIKSFGFHRPF